MSNTPHTLKLKIENHHAIIKGKRSNSIIHITMSFIKDKKYINSSK